MDRAQILKELKLKASRSSGPGGQHANKTATRISLMFDLGDSDGLSESEKAILLEKLPAAYLKAGVLTVSCEATRSQYRNRQLATDQLLALLEKGLRQQKKRKPTKPGKKAAEKRLKEKKETGQLKKLRRKPGAEE